MAPHCSSMVFTHSTPRADTSKKQWCPRAVSLKTIQQEKHVGLSRNVIWTTMFKKQWENHDCMKRFIRWHFRLWTNPWGTGSKIYCKHEGSETHVFFVSTMMNTLFMIPPFPPNCFGGWDVWKPDRVGWTFEEMKNDRNFWPNNNPRLKTFPTNWGCNEKSGGLLILVDMCIYIYIHIYSFVVKNSCWINYHKAINTPNYCHLFNAPSTIIRLINPRLKEPQRQRFTIFTNAALCHLRQQKWQNGSSHEIIPSHAHGAPGLYLYCCFSALAIQPVIFRIILVCVEFATVMNPCHVDFASM